MKFLLNRKADLLAALLFIVLIIWFLFRHQLNALDRKVLIVIEIAILIPFLDKVFNTKAGIKQ